MNFRTARLVCFEMYGLIIVSGGGAFGSHAEGQRSRVDRAS